MQLYIQFFHIQNMHNQVASESHEWFVLEITLKIL